MTTLGIVLGLLIQIHASEGRTCKGVQIHVTNRLSKPDGKKGIKVIAFEYWDPQGDRWRDAAAEDRDIAPGRLSTWTKSLDDVGGRADVRIKITYRYDTGSTGWSSPLHYTSASFTCTDERVVSLTVQ